MGDANRCLPDVLRAEDGHGWLSRKHVSKRIAMAQLLTHSIEAPRNDVVLATPPSRVALRTWGALAILCMGGFLVVVDTTIVNIAITSIITGLHSSLGQVLLVLNALT